MKRKDKDEIKGMSVAELTKKAAELTKKIMDEKLAMLTKEVKNRHAIKEMRKQLAVLLSVRRVKELTEGK